MAEHLESHMFIGALAAEKKLDGFYQNGLFFGPVFTQHRHDALARHIHGHKTPMDIVTELEDVVDDNWIATYPDVKPTEEQIRISRRTLWQRCRDCRKLALEDLHARKSKVHVPHISSSAAVYSPTIRSES